MRWFVRRAFLVLLVLLLVPATALAAKPVTWTYTALGDSLGTGFGAFQGYVSRYRDYMAADTKATVNLTNKSVNGWTSTDLYNAIKTDSTMRSSVKSSQVVTWDIGGNDLRAARTAYKNGTCGGTDNQDCLRSTVATFKSNWDGIVTEIRALRGASVNNTIYRTIDIYNPYVNEDKADGSFSVTKGYLEEINNYIATQAATYGYKYGKVYDAFNGPNHDIDPADKGYIFIDSLHPNDTGHKVIADLLRALGYSPLR
ncbi:MAG TPA: GDSL-type esterase/lipase family protein [Symbiobacteriaceae bacterium]|jgi:lysophospholipase L1-like esterase|nr:GDSL-type esterase/lipase family protein [Symbiobacteriaceae bacterium]